MDSHKNIWMLGDPIEDIYLLGSFFPTIDGQRFNVEELVSCPGGAWNTLNNLTKLLEGTSVKVFKGWQVSPYEFIRLISEDSDEVICFTYETKEALKKVYNRDSATQFIESRVSSIEENTVNDILVVSEYNKGACSIRRNAPVFSYKFDIGIFDSRYKTVDISLINNCKIKILHATGEEFDEEFGAMFDFIIHSNAENPLFIKGKNIDPIKLVPYKVDVINEAGAGDTLVASVAAYLAYYNMFSLPLLVEAVKYGLLTCSEVIQKPYTDTPDTTLIGYIQNVYNES